MTELTLPRRALLGAAGAVLAAPALAQQAAGAVPYSTGTNKSALVAPPFATDCHFHIYNDNYPPAPGGLPAPNASPADYRKLQARTGTTRGVVVQPSLYGTDNRPTLEGVAVVIDTLEDAELQRLHAAGVRGILFNLVQSGTLLTTWVPDPAKRNRVLVDNPAELYDFPRS